MADRVAASRGTTDTDQVVEPPSIRHCFVTDHHGQLSGLCSSGAGGPMDGTGESCAQCSRLTVG